MAAEKKVLITGISGIVGSSAYQQLRKSPERYALYGLGRRRVLSDRVKDGRAIDLPESHHFVCDIADPEGVRQAVEGMDVVVHMAADPGGGDWESLVHSNIIGAQNMFDSCQQAGVSRIIAASTIQVSNGHRHQEPYCAVAQGRVEELPDGVPRISSAVPAEPRNLYASTKIFNESLCRVYSHSHGMSCLAIRIGWVVTEDRPPSSKALDIWCSQRDIATLIECCINAPDSVRFGIFYGVSANRTSWLDMDEAREMVGFVPQDRAEDRCCQEPPTAPGS